MVQPKSVQRSVDYYAKGFFAMWDAVRYRVALNLTRRQVDIAYQAVVIAERKRQDIGGSVAAQEAEIQLLDLGICQEGDREFAPQILGSG